MRLVGCSKRVAKVCNERFSWANGAGSLWRTKLAIVADMLRFETSDDFAKSLGPKWAYHLKPVIELLSLPHYGSMKLARADGWIWSARPMVRPGRGLIWTCPKRMFKRRGCRRFCWRDNCLRGKAGSKKASGGRWGPGTRSNAKARRTCHGCSKCSDRHPIRRC